MKELTEQSAGGRGCLNVFYMTQLKIFNGRMSLNHWLFLAVQKYQFYYVVKGRLQNKQKQKCQMST